MGARQNNAKRLTEKIWGSNFFDSIPAKWKSALRVLRTKIPGVPNDTDPDTPTVVDVNTDLSEPIVATSQVTTNRTNELEKTTEEIQAELLLTSITHGQEYNQEWDVPIPFTEHLSLDNAEVGDNRKEINPLNPVLSEVHTFDPTALAAVFDTYLNYFAGTTNLRLPDVLTSLVAVASSANGTGDYNEAATGGGSGTTYFVSMSEQGDGQGSASTMLGLRVEYKQYFGQNIPTVTYYFFVQSPVTASAILTKLQSLSGLTITAWPQFSPQGHTVTTTGQKINTSARAKAGFQISSSSDGSSAADTAGLGGSVDVSTSKDDVRIPPMLHGSISISGTTSTSVSASASAGATDAVNSISTSKSASAVAGLSPSSFSATTPSSVPSSGVKLLDSRPVLRRFGYVLVEAITVDAAGIT